MKWVTYYICEFKGIGTDIVLEFKVNQGVGTLLVIPCTSTNFDKEMQGAFPELSHTNLWNVIIWSDNQLTVMFTTKIPKKRVSWEFLLCSSLDMLNGCEACKHQNDYLPWRRDLCTFGHCVVWGSDCPAPSSVSSLANLWPIFTWNRRIKV